MERMLTTLAVSAMCVVGVPCSNSISSVVMCEVEGGDVKGWKGKEMGERVGGNGGHKRGRGRGDGKGLREGARGERRIYQIEENGRNVVLIRP